LPELISLAKATLEKTKDTKMKIMVMLSIFGFWFLVFILLSLHLARVFIAPKKHKIRAFTRLFDASIFSAKGGFAYGEGLLSPHLYPL
jgi:hypothetical protein